MTAMTPDDLDKLERLADAATRTSTVCGRGRAPHQCVLRDRHAGSCSSDGPTPSHPEWKVDKLRTAVPALIAEVRRLRGEVERVERERDEAVMGLAAIPAARDAALARAEAAEAEVERLRSEVSAKQRGYDDLHVMLPGPPGCDIWSKVERLIKRSEQVENTLTDALDHVQRGNLELRAMTDRAEQAERERDEYAAIDRTRRTTVAELAQSVPMLQADRDALRAQLAKYEAVVDEGRKAVRAHHSVCGMSISALKNAVDALDKEQPRDACAFCRGTKGGVPGNENVFGGVVACDYCSALLLRIRQGDAADVVRRLVAEVERLRAEVAVTGGEWCAENRRAGRGPCRSCAWCCKQAIARAESAEAEVERLRAALRHEFAVGAEYQKQAAVTAARAEQAEREREQAEADLEGCRNTAIAEHHRLRQEIEHAERERDEETRLAAERWGRDTARWISERDDLKSKLDLLARWVVDHEKYLTGAIDHACARCVPGGDMVSETFVCARHIAHDVYRAWKEKP